MVVELKSVEEMNSLINTGEKVMIDFWAPWCGPCKGIAPAFEALAATESKVILAKLDVQDIPEAAAQFGVRGIPTIMGFSATEKVFHKAGSVAILPVLLKQLEQLEQS
jgi:thioredoxin 1